MTFPFSATAESDARTANDFAAFFKDKVEAVQASTAATMCRGDPRRLSLNGVP